MDLKKRKIAIFAKGIVHDFGQKVEVFHLLCLSKIDREKLFADVLDEKEAFKDYKNNCLRKLEFFERGQSIVLIKKLEISSTLIFLQNRPRKSIWKRSS